MQMQTRTRTFTTLHILSPATKDDLLGRTSTSQIGKLNEYFLTNPQPCNAWEKNIQKHIYCAIALPSKEGLSNGKSMHFSSFRGDGASIATRAKIICQIHQSIT
jgi:hypothetical protein